MTKNRAEDLSAATGLPRARVQAILDLIDDGATIPFIARYRKEQTGGATAETLRHLKEQHDHLAALETRREEVEKLIDDQGQLTERLQNRIKMASTLSALDDLYRPYRKKRTTRAGSALAAGLEPLANLLAGARMSAQAFQARAGDFISDLIPSAEDAVSGAKDIVAERYSDDPREREIVRGLMWKRGVLKFREGKAFESSAGYARYLDHPEPIAGIPSHRYLAVMRAVRENQLGVRLLLDLEPILRGIDQDWVPRNAGSSSEILMDALADGLKRLLLPSIEREVHAELKKRSDEQAVRTFGRNLRQLLMTPPVSGMTILGVDPAFRTGCKLAVVNEHGRYLDQGVIYPTPPHNRYEESRDTVLELAARHGISGVAIGNGTACRETQEFFARINAESDSVLPFTIVSEAGASVYSASPVAEEEYPELDVTIRGAISIAQRLQNPMAALVKIDPQSLGIGQYQHDVDQGLLKRRLTETTEDLVNNIGVEVNSASAQLLSYVAGLGAGIARRIVAHRERQGPFSQKMDLLSVRGLGEIAFQQCAGFLRIRDGASVLDNTAVHPESYVIATAVLERYPGDRLESADPDEVTRSVLSTAGEDRSKEASVGPETIRDIIAELRRPGFDPRTELPAVPFRKGITDISMLGVGDVVSGVVRSIVDFGAFVDIGLKNDGLIHVSEISEHRISHPMEVLSVNQYLPAITVLTLDSERGKIGLTLRAQTNSQP